MTSIDEQTSNDPTVASAASATPAGARRNARVVWGAGAAVALLVAALVTAMVAGGDGGASDDASSAGASTTVAARPATTDPSAAATATSAQTVAPSTSAVPVATAPTAAPNAAASAPAAAAAPGAPPPPYQGPVQAISFDAGAVNNATVATAAVGTVSVYRQPLQSPAPAFAEWSFESATQFGSPTVFLVTGTAGDWLRVQLPMKPNMVEGWVHNSEVSLAPNRHRIVVDLANRTVTLYDGASAVAQSIAVVGKSGTPTPTGTYYVTDLLQLDDPTTAYGPYVLATSARSDAFDFFNGGEPIVALHGTNQPSLLGSAASNGCVRLPNDVATQLAALTPLGTPVFIV